MITNSTTPRKNALTVARMMCGTSRIRSISIRTMLTAAPTIIAYHNTLGIRTPSPVSRCCRKFANSWNAAMHPAAEAAFDAAMAPRSN